MLMFVQLQGCCPDILHKSCLHCFAAKPQRSCNKRAAARISIHHIVAPLSSANGVGDSSSDINDNTDKDNGVKNNSSSSISTSIFDRTHEREQLDALLGQSPASIRVILGPRSCGKSTFLRDYVLQQKLNNSICYIDCRMFDITTPDGFAEVLVQQGLPALIRNIDWEHWEQVKTPVLAVADMFSLKVPAGFGSEVTVKMADLFKQVVLGEQSSKSGLKKVIQAYESLLKGWEAARKENKCFGLQWPVLIIDEANVLQAWSGTHERDLGTLLRFFVGNTKDMKRCHVLLVTSEYGFQYWLDKSKCV
jgi:ATPase domain predominantly from Archaea